MEACCLYHDRLDLIRHIEAYQAPGCGTVNPQTGKPDYCCFECPALLERIKETLRDPRTQT